VPTFPFGALVGLDFWISLVGDLGVGDLGFGADRTFSFK